MTTQKKCTLRNACETLKHLPDDETALRKQGIAYLGSYQVQCLRVLLDVAESLVEVYDEHELGSRHSHTSAADDAAALYDVLNQAGMPVA